MGRFSVLILGLLSLGQGSTRSNVPASLHISHSSPALVASQPGWAALRLRLIPETGPGPAVTPLSPDHDGWTLPDVAADGAAAAEAAQPPGALPALARLKDPAQPTWPVVRVVEVWTGRDARWTRVTLELSSRSGTALSLAGVHVAAVGEQGSPLMTLPGLYSRTGTVQASIPAGRTLVASCWIMLPSEGRGDTALRGTELASALILLRADDHLRLDLKLPRR